MRGLAGSLLFLAILGVSGCGNEEAGQAEEPGAAQPSTEEFVAADRVCDGAFSRVARDLEGLTGAVEFVDRPALGESLDIPAFIRALRESQGAEEQFCRVFTPTSGILPALEVFFGWEPPDDGTESTTEDGTALRYDTGESALSRNQSAVITFPCTVEGRDGDLLKARLASPRGGEPDERITVLNAASLAIARGFGCLDESGLSTGPPQRLEP
ncbi:hypothetical protein [Streptomyces sp. MP131-18]|uniref:hypothetical protein n=1 Tax=Streptomyces sp. MP131-18 TaxID=1857892 RepID=UPI00117D50B8|nr:hypothetical protein [Streptomyces sp. MP131-18]